MSVCRSSRMCVLVRMGILTGPVDIELHAADARLLASRDMDVPAVKIEFFQLVFERLSVKTQVDHRAKKHVATDAAENVEVKRFHRGFELEGLDRDPSLAAASSLIWLAA